MQRLMKQRRKKQDLEKCIKTLNEDIGKYSTEAEDKADLVQLTKAKSLRKINVKKENIKAFHNALQKL